MMACSISSLGKRLALSLSSRFSRYGHLYIVLILHILNPVLRYDLDQHALEVDRETSLELLCAHPQDLQTLLVVHVWVMVLV